jgi:hypothetical protein
MRANEGVVHADAFLSQNWARKGLSLTWYAISDPKHCYPWYKAQEGIGESPHRNPEESEDTTLGKLGPYRVNRLIL